MPNRLDPYTEQLLLKFRFAQRDIDRYHREAAMASLTPTQRFNIMRSSQNRVTATLMELHKETDSYFAAGQNDILGKVYRAGYSDQVQNVNRIMRSELPESTAINASDRSFLSRQRSKGRGDMIRALESTDARSRALIGQEGKHIMDTAPDGTRRGGLHGVDLGGRQYKLDTYSDLVLQGRASQVYNRGSLRALKDLGYQTIHVIDGPGCGWTTHNDADHADGKEVSIEEALAHPVAHPFCQRQFTFSPKDKKLDPDQKKRWSALKKATTFAGAAAAAGGGVVAWNQRATILKSLNEFMLRSETLWRQYDLRIRALERQLQQLSSLGELPIDIRTGKPMSTNLVDMSDRILADAQHWDDGVDFNMSDQTRFVLGIQDSMNAEQVSDRVGDFYKFVDAQHKAGMSDRLLTDLDQVDRYMRNQVVSEVSSYGDAMSRGPGSNMFGDVVTDGLKKTRLKIAHGPADRVVDKIETLFPNNSVARMTLPRIHGGGQAEEGLQWLRALRLRLQTPNFLKFTGTAKGKSVNVGSLVVNRNGLLRAGFQKTKEGLIYPRLSIVPRWAPIRITSRVNRSVAENTFGAINSISGELHLLLPGPFKPSMNFNFDLRSLSLSDFWDVRDITMRDLKGLGWDNFRMKSLAVESRFRLMGRLDAEQTFRMKWKDATYLFRKSDFILANSGEIERRYGIVHKLKLLEAKYFLQYQGLGADAAMAGWWRGEDEYVRSWSKFRDVAGKEARQYYENVTHDMLDFVVNFEEYAKTALKTEYLRQKDIALEEVVAVKNWAREIGAFVKNIDPESVAMWIEDRRGRIPLTIMQKFLDVSDELRLTRQRTMDILDSIHNRLFVELPAQRRRRALRLVSVPQSRQDILSEAWEAKHAKLPLSERIRNWSLDFMDHNPFSKGLAHLNDGWDEWYQTSLDEYIDDQAMGWPETIRLWGASDFEIANKFGVNWRGAVAIRERIGERINGSYRRLKEFMSTAGQDDAAVTVANASVNKNLNLGEVNDWRDLHSQGDKAIEAVGRFFKWVDDMIVRGRIKSVDELAPKPVTDDFSKILDNLSGNVSAALDTVRAPGSPAGIELPNLGIVKHSSAPKPAGFDDLVARVRQAARDVASDEYTDDDILDVWREFALGDVDEGTYRAGRSLITDRKSGDKVPGVFDELRDDLRPGELQHVREQLDLDFSKTYHELDGMSDFDLFDQVDQLLDDDIDVTEIYNAWHNGDVPRETFLKQMSIVKNMRDNFGMTDVKLGFFSDAEANEHVHGSFRYNKRLLKQRRELLTSDDSYISVDENGNEVTAFMRDYFRSDSESGWHPMVNDADSDIGILVHELGHEADMSRAGTWRHSDELVDLMADYMDEEHGGFMLPEDLYLDEYINDPDIGDEIKQLQAAMEEFEATVYQLPAIDAMKMNPMEVNNFIYLWKFISLNAESLQGMVSGYATTNPAELVAELMLEATLSPSPSGLSLRVASWLRSMERIGNVGFWFD